jgi:hypothetical protein
VSLDDTVDISLEEFLTQPYIGLTAADLRVKPEGFNEGLNSRERTMTARRNSKSQK